MSRYVLFLCVFSTIVYAAEHNRRVRVVGNRVQVKIKGKESLLPNKIGKRVVYDKIVPTFKGARFGVVLVPHTLFNPVSLLRAENYIVHGLSNNEIVRIVIADTQKMKKSKAILKDGGRLWSFDCGVECVMLDAKLNERMPDDGLFCITYKHDMLK
jgi:hypothetical protein